MVKDAMAKPIDTPKFSELAAGKNNIVIIASDHTRPVHL
ncbi:MAG: lactate racemase domain-containing protein [Eubacteriales bacterium]|nr:lactate racemase domain-containing protein [Oscillospiraceae bacterium]MDD3833088.1 lactate racemase domain-containing protein [Oscillospiraceae bacterium]MDD4495433.1 lactate racemase domain-containing protein [Eubacteriales bacterium]